MTETAKIQMTLPEDLIQNYAPSSKVNKTTAQNFSRYLRARIINELDHNSIEANVHIDIAPSGSGMDQIMASTQPDGDQETQTMVNQIYFDAWRSFFSVDLAYQLGMVTYEQNRARPDATVQSTGPEPT